MLVLDEHTLKVWMPESTECWAVNVHAGRFITGVSRLWLARCSLAAVRVRLQLGLAVHTRRDMKNMRMSVEQSVWTSSWPPGMTLTLLQLALKFVGLASIPAFTKLYQGTLDWFPGFVFMLSSILTVVGMIPVRYVLCDPDTNPFHRFICLS